jgi:hypothetical protein
MNWRDSGLLAILAALVIAGLFGLGAATIPFVAVLFGVWLVADAMRRN